MKHLVSNCKLCNRVKALTSHHLIPVTVHKNKWFKKNFDRLDMKTRRLMICKDCHDYIHKILKPKELGRYFNTEKKLRENEKIAKFIVFAKKKK